MITELAPFIKAINSDSIRWWGSIFESNKVFDIVHSNILFPNSPNTSFNKRKLKNNEVAFKLQVVKEICNKDGLLDNGGLASLIDYATTLMNCYLDPKTRIGVSIELSLKFLYEIKENSLVYIINRFDGMSGDIIHCSVEIIDASNLNVLATSTHTQLMSFLLDKKTVNDLKPNNKSTSPKF